MIFAAIDIGTNAARLLVGEVIKHDEMAYVKKVSYTRVPLRLGLEVFDTGEISEKKAVDFIKTIKAFKLITEVFEVKEIRACATSAMREASNGKQIRKRILKETGVEIDIIEGDEEAELIFSTFSLFQVDPNEAFVVVDVGGGSTEINVFKNGERKTSRSFKIGTIRMLKDKVDKDAWNEMESWIRENVTSKKFKLFGTGGNINKAHKLMGRSLKSPLGLSDINGLYNELSPLNLEDRMDRYQLKPDRADVIVPAMEIYGFVMKVLEKKSIYVPRIGLSDGMIFTLYNKHVELK